MSGSQRGLGIHLQAILPMQLIGGTAAGVVDGRPAMLVFDRNVSLDTPAHFVALTFKGERVAAIHDFLFARYAIDGVDLLRWDRAP
jgi:hypothetical protein